MQDTHLNLVSSLRKLRPKELSAFLGPTLEMLLLLSGVNTVALKMNIL